MSLFDQEAFDIRCEWGPEGIRRLAPTSEVAIIIDIFSFTTSVCIAVSQGGRVYPFGGDRQSAHDFAREHKAIPAGERWPDGSLRPALEDQIGAGAIIHMLAGSRSPEALAAEAVYLRFQADLLHTLQQIASGMEAIQIGSLRDLELAAEQNVSDIVPHLVNGLYQAFLW